MFFALFVMFQICRLDSLTGEFSLTGETVHIHTDHVAAIQETPHSGDTHCVRISAATGQGKYVHGTIAEIIAKLTNMNERR